MALSNSGFHTSEVENRIYDLMEKRENIFDSANYNTNLFAEVVEMMQDEFPSVEWEAQSIANNRDSFTMSFAYVEDGHIHLLIWGYNDD